MSELDGLPLVLTVEEVAAVLRIGRSAAYQAVRDGSIPSVRIGGRSIRVPRHQLEALLGSEDGDGPAETGPPRNHRTQEVLHVGQR